MTADSLPAAGWVLSTRLLRESSQMDFQCSGWAKEGKMKWQWQSVSEASGCSQSDQKETPKSESCSVACWGSLHSRDQRMSPFCGEELCKPMMVADHQLHSAKLPYWTHKIPNDFTWKESYPLTCSRLIFIRSKSVKFYVFSKLFQRHESLFCSYRPQRCSL